jgi:hypothetical protein
MRYKVLGVGGRQLSVQIGDNNVILPGNPHSFEFSQAVVGGRLILLSGLLGEEGDVGEAVEYDLIDVIKFREGLNSIYYPSFHADYYLTFNDVHLLDEAIGQRIRRLGRVFICLLFSFLVLWVLNLKKYESVAGNDQFVIGSAAPVVGLHLHLEMYFGEQFLLVEEMQGVKVVLLGLHQQANIWREGVLVEEGEGGELKHVVILESVVFLHFTSLQFCCQIKSNSYKKLFLELLSIMHKSCFCNHRQ